MYPRDRHTVGDADIEPVPVRYFAGDVNQGLSSKGLEPKEALQLILGQIAALGGTETYVQTYKRVWRHVYRR